MPAPSPEAQVEAQFALTAVARVMARMSDSDRAVLTTIDGAPRGDRRMAVRMNVQRHRARQRLLLMVEGLIGWMAVVWRTLRQRGHRVAPALAIALLPVAMSLSPC